MDNTSHGALKRLGLPVNHDRRDGLEPQRWKIIVREHTGVVFFILYLMVCIVVCRETPRLKCWWHAVDIALQSQSREIAGPNSHADNLLTIRGRLLNPC